MKIHYKLQEGPMINLTAMFIVAVVFFSIIAFVKTLCDSRTRHELIAKGMVDDKVKYLYSGRLEAHVPSSLKWGIVLICIGLAFLVSQLVPEAQREEITAASVFILAGIGLLLYYFIAKRAMKKMEEKEK